MVTYRVYSRKLVHEDWYCDVEADSKEVAKAKYDLTNDVRQDREIKDLIILDAEEKTNFDDSK